MTKTEEIMALHDAAATEFVHGHYHPMLEKRAALKAAIEKLVKDAARYQWLRGQHWSTSSMCVVLSPTKNVMLGAVCPSGDLLDADIDAAMEKTP